MKLSDAVWGAVLLLFAASILVHIQSFPPMSGQRYGPAVFPGLVAGALAVCAVLLIVNGLRHRSAEGVGHTWFTFAPWTRSRRHVLAFLLVVGVNVFYILFANALGFIPTGIVYLVALFLVFGVPARLILPLAIVVTLGIHYVFYKLLRVPLPWGVLERVAW